jgi:RimJ/RimL family protein N-acetyltransferase
MLSDPLFEGQLIHLTGLNLDTDSLVEAKWTADLEYARKIREIPVRPIAAFEMKDIYEEVIKESVKSEKTIHFAVRLKGKEHVIGFLRFSRIQWSHAAARLELAIGDPGVDQHLCALDALKLALNYAFRELNLHRLTVVVGDYETEAIRLYEEMGFVLEVRQRDLFFRSNRYWDALHYGILRTEWVSKGSEAQS